MAGIEFVFGRELTGRGAPHPGPGGDDQGPVRSSQRGAEGFDGAPIYLADLFESREVMDKTGVDHAIRFRRSTTQAFQVFQVTSMNFRAGRSKPLGGRIGASQA